MKTFGNGWFRDGSLMAEFADSLGSNLARQKSSVALRASKVEAELASKAKSEFIANMSHELRTPLNAIIGFSDMLRTMKSIEPDKVEQYAGYIHEAAAHLLTLINEVLDISKIQAGKLNCDIQDTDVYGALRGCLLLIEPRARDRNIELGVDVSGDLPTVPADPLRLKQVLINVLSNAVKFTPEGGSVMLEAERWGEDGVAITIADTGPGMTEQEMQMAMQPFGQVHSGLGRTTEGTGLGLPIAMAIVRAHGGELTLDSLPGTGTRVTLKLTGHSAAATAAGGPPPAHAMTLSAAGGQTPHH